jgi:predicted membrane-bound dolichyl-phosphate-mannose-protein mannosyltransferase
LIAILAIGLVVRLIMAYGIDAIRGSGFKTDLDLFRYWGSNLADLGPFGFYDRGFFADYTPGYLYILWLVGIVGKAVGGIGDLIKLPAILADIALATTVWSMARELGATNRRARIAAAVVIVNPVLWFDSVLWGQVDSVGVVVLLLAIRQLWRGRSERAAILAVVAAMIKPQLAILVPIVAAVVIRRALWPVGGFGNERAPEDRPGLLRMPESPIRILTTGLAGLLTAVVLAAPFGLSLVSFTSTAPYIGSSLLRLFFSTASTYSYITVNAYNMWALFPVNGGSMATNSGWIHDAPVPDATTWASIGPLPAGIVGATLMLATMAVITVLVARRPDRLTILVGTIALALAFFGIPTRVHERYLFPFFGLAAILWACSFRWRIAYVVASTATFLNMYVVLTTLYPDNPGVADWLGIGDTARSFWGVAAIAVTNTAVLLWGLAQLRGSASRKLAIEVADATSDESFEATYDGADEVDLEADDGDREPAPVFAQAHRIESPEVASAEAWTPPPLAMTAPDVLPPPASTGRRLPAWYDRPSWTSLGPIAALRARWGETPIRPDRSSSLKGERAGRLDRLDVWILIVLVVASFGLRTWRLAEPGRMHFDEVYHARTATEFLQEWRYGISHNIYEWTHPHLAKYAMAVGIEVFAGHDVAATSDLGVPVRDAAVEPRRADASSASARNGDRAWVVTGTELIAYDLQTRGVVGRWSIPGASTVTVDPAGTSVYVGTDAGTLLVLDTQPLDLLRRGGGSQPEPADVGTLASPAVQLVAWEQGTRLAARLADGSTAIVDTATGATLATLHLEGVKDLAIAGDGDALVAAPADVTDAAAVASALAAITGADAATYQAALAKTDAPSVLLDVTLTTDMRPRIQEAIDAGTLTGVSITKTPLIAVADAAGIDLVTDEGTIAATVEIPGGVSGLALVTGLGSGNQLYATTTDQTTTKPQISTVATSGDQAKTGPSVTGSFELPAAATRVVFDDASQFVFALGTTQDGNSQTVYVVEPHGNAVFADHKLPFTPVALVLDHTGDYPTATRGQLLAFNSAGTLAAADVAHYDFAWRLPGVIAGALTVGLLFLLTRVLFRRRTVGVLAGIFVVLDGMFFVQSRIAMNDVYVGMFILAAYLLFAWLWVEPRAKRWFWALMPVVGVLLGLGLASKWVAAYAVGALGILVLARSALGRLLLIVALIGLTAVLGWMALAVPDPSKSSGNLLFPMIMVLLTMAAAAITVFRPIAWTTEEIVFAVGGPPALGMLIALTGIATGRAATAIALGPVSATPLAAGFALVVLGGLVYLAFKVAGRMGFGPFALTRDGPLPADASPEGWLRLGYGLGAGTAWMAICLVAIPVVVYVISYIPWANVESHQIVAGWPAGHTGQLLLDLTGDMYRYHNNLTAAHPASSPWWAWPLDLKPVWFYQDSYAGGTGAAIYDSGNLVIWWLGVPAMAFAAWQAYRRRSLALALIVIGFAAQWVSWARIDRAAFQYHYYTSLPFVVMALAYFIAELWHGASRRVWLLARAAAALAILGPALMWLFKGPLCAIANVELVNKGSQACHGNPGNLVLTPSVTFLIVVLVIALVILGRQLIALGRPRADGRDLEPRDLLPLLASAIGAGAAIAITRFIPGTQPLISIPGLVPELIALAGLIPLSLVAVQVLTARDSRRFVLGYIAVAASWFLILYPNIAALPLPSDFVPAYQGILPTYLYPFQFGVNTVERSGAITFADPKFGILAGFLVAAVLVVSYSAWSWRQAMIEEAQRAVRGEDGNVGAPPLGDGGAVPEDSSSRNEDG